MWLISAVASAFFAGVTSILAKCGIKKTDSDVATAVRTIIIFAFSWLIVFISGSYSQIKNIDGSSVVFLVLSGLSTGISWLCYFKALQMGDINKVVPIDKSSTVLTILLALVLFHEGISAAKIVAIVSITTGVFMMINKKETTVAKSKNGWFWYACGSAIFAALTAILGKPGMKGLPSDLGTAIRTSVVLVMAWLVVFVSKKQNQVKLMDKKELVFISCSGVTTGASWLCYYHAIQNGPVSVVAPVDKLSILVTVVFSYFVFGEKLNRKELVGLILLTFGTIFMAFL